MYSDKFYRLENHENIRLDETYFEEKNELNMKKRVLLIYMIENSLVQ